MDGPLCTASDHLHLITHRTYEGVLLPETTYLQSSLFHKHLDDIFYCTFLIRTFMSV